ncbi:hypothetical protein AB0F91_33095 [Amycolatopsis sp. NPDC023774]|uniref:hypothetical protein n=1 Tax=Amycolatopsis sp. NPDC023774 TaxID=3155015 RepID=UPI0033FAE798
MAWRAGLVIAPLLAVSLASIVLVPLTRLEPLWRLLAAVWICWVCAGGLIGAARPDQSATPRLSRVAIGESSPVKVRCSLTNSTTPTGHHVAAFRQC